MTASLKQLCVGSLWDCELDYREEMIPDELKNVLRNRVVLCSRAPRYSGLHTWRPDVLLRRAPGKRSSLRPDQDPGHRTVSLTRRVRDLCAFPNRRDVGVIDGSGTLQVIDMQTGRTVASHAGPIIIPGRERKLVPCAAVAALAASTMLTCVEQAWINAAHTAVAAPAGAAPAPEPTPGDAVCLVAMNVMPDGTMQPGQVYTLQPEQQAVVSTASVGMSFQHTIYPIAGRAVVWVPENLGYVAWTIQGELLPLPSLSPPQGDIVGIVELRYPIVMVCSSHCMWRMDIATGTHDSRIVGVESAFCLERAGPDLIAVGMANARVQVFSASDLTLVRALSCSLPVPGPRTGPVVQLLVMHDDVLLAVIEQSDCPMAFFDLASGRHLTTLVRTGLQLFSDHPVRCLHHVLGLLLEKPLEEDGDPATV